MHYQSITFQKFFRTSKVFLLYFFQKMLNIHALLFLGKFKLLKQMKRTRFSEKADII